MNIYRKLARSTAIRGLGDILRIILQFLITITIIRSLGKEEFGKYAVIFAYLYFFRTIIEMGINTFLIREIARDKKCAGHLIGNCMMIEIFLAVIAVSLSIFIMHLTDYAPIIKTGTLLGATILLFLPLQVVETIFLANLKQEYPIGLITFTKSAALLLLYIVIRSGKTSLITFVLIITICQAAYMVLIFVFSRKFVEIKYKLDFELTDHQKYPSR